MKSKAYSLILMTLIGTLGSVIVGFLFYNTAIFHSDRSNFLFVSAGLYGAFFFSLLGYKNLREQVFGMMFVFFLNMIIFSGRFISLASVTRDLLWLGGLFLSVKLYYLFLKRNPNLKFYLRSLALAFIFGLLNIIFGSILYFINAGWNIPPINIIYFFARYGILIGFGLGMGLDFYLQNKKQIFNLLKIE